MMMNSRSFFLLLTFIITLNVFPQSIQQYMNIGNFEIVSGDTIYDCMVGFRTFGKPNTDTSNAVIYCSWFGGNSGGIATLIEKRNFIDTSKYFIIAFDALGDGISSSPSNYSHNNFPDITIRDMVNSQYVVLTKHLGIERLYGAIGGSMGSMQVLEWTVAYPHFINKIVAYVCSPKLTAYDLLWMNTQLRMMETLRKYGSTEKEIKTLSDMMTAWISRTPEYVSENIKVEDFENYFMKFENEPIQTFTNDNYIAQMKAMIQHDISREFNNSMEEAANAIKANLFLIVSKNDMMVNPLESIRLAELTNSRLLILDNNCGHLAVSCEFDRVKSEIDDFLSNK